MSTNWSLISLNTAARMLLELHTLRQYVYMCTAGAHASRVTVIQIHQWYMSSAKKDLVRMVMLCGHC